LSTALKLRQTHMSKSLKIALAVDGWLWSRSRWSVSWWWRARTRTEVCCGIFSKFSLQFSCFHSFRFFVSSFLSILTCLGSNDFSQRIHFPGVEHISISFDDNCKTSDNAWVTIYQDESFTTVWGMLTFSTYDFFIFIIFFLFFLTSFLPHFPYHFFLTFPISPHVSGPPKLKQLNWPGAAGRPPLVVCTDSLWIHFFSDAHSSADYGFKVCHA
jgi:hypothetical protein